MKKILFALVMCMAFCVSCTQEDLSVKSKKYTETNDSAILPMEIQEVNVPDGQVAIYTNMAGDTIAVVPESDVIVLPKTSVTRASNDGIKVTYVPQNEINPFTFGQVYYETIAFEDKDADDYDYNDFVFHVEYTITNGHTYIAIQPIAYGAQYDIELYIQGSVYQCKAGKYIQKNAMKEPLKVCDNVRKDLFSDETHDFINTDPANDLRLYPVVKTIDDSHIKINKNEFLDTRWIIHVKNTDQWYSSIPMTQRVPSAELGLYTMVGNKKVQYNNLYSADNIPFGIAFCDIYGAKVFKSKDGVNKPYYPCGADWFFFPTEKTDIEIVYPNFRKWLENGDKANFKWYSPIGTYINVVGDDDEISLYEFNREELKQAQKKGQKYITVKRKNKTGFDISGYIQ